MLPVLHLNKISMFRTLHLSPLVNSLSVSAPRFVCLLVFFFLSSSSRKCFQCQYLPLFFSAIVIHFLKNFFSFFFSLRILFKNYLVREICSLFVRMSTAATKNTVFPVESLTVNPPQHPTYDLKQVIKLALSEDAGDLGNFYLTHIPFQNFL